jgi:hypothetical protein
MAIGCKKLIATSTYLPKPVEVCKAIRSARGVVAWARDAAFDALEEIVACDAIMLQYASVFKWRAPWESPEMRPHFPKMYEWHQCSDHWCEDDSSFRPALVHAKKLLDEVPE